MKRLFSALPWLFAAAAFAAPPAGTKLADEVAVDAQFTLSAETRVSFGDPAADAWAERNLVAGTYPCSGPTFGLAASPATPRKQCKITYAAGGTVAPAYRKVADEFWSFDHLGGEVRFGLDGKTVSKVLPAGRQSCTVGAMGADPVVGKAKICEVPVVAPVSTKTEPVTDATPAPAPVSGNDVATPEAYRARIATLGTDAWFTYKYGSPSTKPLPTTSYPGPRPSYSMGDLSGQHNPLKTLPDGVKGGRGCGVGADAWCGEYQLGTLAGWPGDYSSSIINVAYTPDVPVPAGFRENKYWGVASLQVLNIGHGTVSWKPEPSWTTWISPSMNNADNDENTIRLAGARGGSPIGTIELDAKPVAAARGYGRGGWVNNTITVYANGAMTTSGSNTSHNFAKLQLPNAFKPTALAISNSGEFALVAGWNPSAFKGQVAVVALADGCQWCEDKPESQWNPNWGSGRGAYPGMPGLGNYVGMKLVGFVDLPDSVKAPTDIAVTTGKYKRYDNGYERVQQLWTDNMLTATNRARWYDGELRGAMARTGMAVVTSKSEQRAAYLDLRPLFMYYREQYVGPQTDAQWNAKIAARGSADNQFPQGFMSAPQQKPTVIKVVDLASRPTAVRMMPSAPQRALLATEDGKLSLIDLGDKYLDQLAQKTGSPADIAEISSINVGANPTSIAHVEEKARLDKGRSYLWNDNTEEEFFWWALSRGERKATLLRLNAGATAFSVYKTLQDPRLVDPIAIYDGANHGTESYIATILDYTGRSVSSWLYGPLVMHTYDDKAPCTQKKPCAPLDGAAFEFLGAHKLPGKPFAAGLSNIN